MKRRRKYTAPAKTLADDLRADILKRLEPPKTLAGDLAEHLRLAAAAGDATADPEVRWLVRQLARRLGVPEAKSRCAIGRCTLDDSRDR